MSLHNVSLAESERSNTMANDNDTKAEIEIYEEYQVPFCRPFRCNIASLRGSNTTSATTVLWECVPSDCKAFVSVLLGAIVMLAAMTVTFNCLILGINLASKTRRMRKRNPTMSNYSIYVVSLAVADLLVGVVVLPLCVVNFYLEFMANALRSSGYVWAVSKTIIAAESRSGYHQGRIFNLIASGDGDIISDMTTIQPTTVENLGDYDKAMIVRVVLGVFTHLTLFVSIYTLITASADRFYAASYSVHLTSMQISKSGPEQTKAGWLRHMVCSLRRSTVAVVIVWICGILFALAPLAMKNSFYFRHIGHVFAAMTSVDYYSTGVRWYLFILVIPLIGMWILNLMICFSLWRRKSQLGLRRKKSLRRQHVPSPAAKNVSPRLASTSDSVFEFESKTPVVKKFPASTWNTKSPKQSESKPKLVSRHVLSRSRPSNGSGGTRTPASCRSTQWDSRGSGLRRKVSSLRRAKELLRRQSYEANITKTLCIVVVAFTLAVLPLILTLSTITLGHDASKKTLNREVTALSCSLLLLFSNSFMNCVIYGARMRDFRTTLCQIFRSFCDKIKNAFCCYCLHSNENFSSEVVNGVFLVTKHKRAEIYQRSPRLGGCPKQDRFFPFPPASSRRSNNSTLDNHYAVSKSENNIASPLTKIMIEGVSNDHISQQTQKQKKRPSSSGYRTDQELHSTHEDDEKLGLSSQRIGRCEGSTLSVPTTWRSSSFVENENTQRLCQSLADEESPPPKEDDDNHEETKLLIDEESNASATNGPKVVTPHGAEEATLATPSDNVQTNIKIENFVHVETDSDQDEFSTANDNNDHPDPTHRQSSDFTLDIDFANFSSL